MFDHQYLEDIYKKKKPHRFYKETVSHAAEMSVHVNGASPQKLLSLVRPNEPSEIKKYRLDSYQPCTVSLVEKVVNTVNKIYNSRLYSVDFPEMKGDDSLEKYLNSDIPFYKSLMNFIDGTITQLSFGDPNACIVVVPVNFEIQDSKRFEPIPFIHGSDKLIDFVDGQHFCFLIGEKIEIYTDMAIFHYTRVLRNGKNLWDLTFEYNHNFGFPPVSRVGGIISGGEKPYFFKSWIKGVLPHWNQVISLTSDLQAAYVNHLYLEKWEYATDCEAKGCNGGHISTVIFDGMKETSATIQCQTCNGSGKVSRSPYGIHTISRDSMNPDSPLPTPPAGYIEKSIDVITKVEERISKEEARGLASINMEIVQMVGENQSGVAKTVDREDLNSFLLRYSNFVFDNVLPRLILDIATWRYSETHNIEAILPHIVKPKDFNILSLDSMTAEYKEASNAKVSSNYLQHLETEIVNSKFSNDEEGRLKNKAIINLQPYPSKSIDDLLTLQALGEKSWSIYKSIHIIELVEQAYDSDQLFLDKTLVEQKNIIDNLAKKESGFVDIALISAQSSGGNLETPNNIEAEAKAKLKGSVGGVQGILEIQSSVASGITDYNAAIALLYEIFGFDLETASKILGTPKKVNNLTIS